MRANIFDPRHRMEHIQRLLKEKRRLRELIDDDIKELEKSLRDMEEMINQSEKVMYT